MSWNYRRNLFKPRGEIFTRDAATLRCIDLHSLLSLNVGGLIKYLYVLPKIVCYENLKSYVVTNKVTSYRKTINSELKKIFFFPCRHRKLTFKIVGH